MSDACFTSDHRRHAPRERFTPPVDMFDLEAAAKELMQEPEAGQHGHRQMALFKHGAATIALYCFEKGSQLPDHCVDGSVVIHVLKGRLTVDADGEVHDLKAARLLRLAPGVVHDVKAEEDSQMLLMVCVETK